MSDRSEALEPSFLNQRASGAVIDRIAPTQHPNRRAGMRQNWRDLLFLHWPVPVNTLRPLIPQRLDLDLFDGTAYVGLVPFTMNGVRPVGFPPVRGLSSFHETNVRTYVRLGERDPGVWFFSLDAANQFAVWLARNLFHLPYHYARMFLEHEPLPRPHDSSTTVPYAGVRHWPGPLPASYTIRATPTGPIQPAQPGTLDHFLAERYLLYTTHKNQLYQGQVHHTPYPLLSAHLHSFNESLLTAAGIERPETKPIVHFARGVNVDIFPLRRV